MREPNSTTADLNWYIRFGITSLVIIIGFIYYLLFKNTSSSDDVVSMPGISSDSCAVCNRLTTKICSRCKLVRYCSESCQRSHWKNGHKKRCDEFRLSGTGNSTQIKKILFPYDKFVELFNWNSKGFPPCGLMNCGNSCFANVVLQCLAYTRPLAAYLLEKGHRHECRRNDWCILCELQAHMERVRQSNHAFSPVNILSRLPNIGGNLGHGKQEDAHEFMRFVIDTMQLVCLDEYGGERYVHPSSQETTLIQHIFGGRLQSQVVCTKCNNVSNQFENMMDLTVEIQGDAASLEECLDQFTAKEWLDGDNKYRCDGCNDYVLAWKRLNIHMAPNILTIALKRFQSGRFGKLNKRVTFPESLDLSPYMSESADGSDKYKLYAVVVHLDMLNASYFGHYICYTKDFSGNWYRIDDCKVDAVELDEVLSQEAYMLLYSRVSARQSCLNSTEETSRKFDRPNVSQEAIPVKSHPVDRSLTAESVDSESTMDIDTADSNTRSSILGDNGDSGNDCTVAFEDETEANKIISIQADVGDDIKGMTGNSVFSSSSNGEEANGMDYVNLGSKPEPEKRVMPSSSVTKLKPLISPGFLGKRPRKVLNSKKDENALESENGDLKAAFKNNGVVESDDESVVVENGRFSDVGKE
ncbi:ubiquitin carboxyl-terminal hydrolase 18-like isoform X2 [Bidens hawaiensis]|uniref:ubiquitin carboxyl-terminal hydrolase 18-like isoform X2 n=1 Tax=Bidens hawaiensis TaxID=980011 RepID=UPI00404B1E72